MTARSKHDIAYGCFLVPVALGLTGVVAERVPMNDANAAGIGFFILIPLTLAALAATVIGVFCSIVLWRDGVLPFLSVLTLLMATLLFLETGKTWVYGLIYGILVLLLEASWFFVRRRRLGIP